jgi:CheY-like chemotaxis protein
MADNDLSLKNVKILVAEDNQLNQLVIKRYLVKWQANYEITDNGLKALDLIKQKDFDLIFLDIQMPGMDGYEIAFSTRQLAEKKYKELPIIALTGSVSTDIADKIKSSGMNDYIIKPFNPDELFLKICKFIKKESFN